MLAVPIYAMMANALPPWARREIVAICRRFFWAGADQSVRGKCAVNWPAVARPFELGGLGVLDLRLMGYALQTRWLWLQRCTGDTNREWSALPLSVAPEVRCLFDASTHWVIGNGESTLFWADKWIDGNSVGDLAPALLPLVAKRTRSRQSVACGLAGGQWIRELTGALSVQAIVQYLHLWVRVQEMSLQPSVQDRLVWRWSQNGEFSVRSAYLAMHAGSLSFPELSLIWKTWAPLRVKIFLWLAWRRRHWIIMGSRQGWNVFSATLLKSQATTSSSGAPLPERCGTWCSFPLGFPAHHPTAVMEFLTGGKGSVIFGLVIFGVVISL
ncbi:hypothetical protein U9M48_014539 [Paspalum notatum var. saurae]|uniref:Reverse transcriptase zinc-binding domain-containing protein n=1 Tax=Paspalum notatum var. saurae TaxID=547442 RepID=A0AAQ3WKU0_PASNO